MIKKPEGQHKEADAKRRFERAVDIALHTPPMHREKKPGAAKKAPRPAKAHKGGKSGGK